MKYFLTLLSSLVFFPLRSMASTSLPSSTLPSIKVSELNASLFSAFYDFFYRIGQAFFDAVRSLRDFITVGDWFLVALQLPHTRDLIIKFSLQVFLTTCVAWILTEGIALLFKRKINSLLTCKESPPLKKTLELGKSIVLTVLPPLSFGFFFYTISHIISPHNETYVAVTEILCSGVVTIWVFLNIAHLFLRPKTATQQHLPLSQDVLNATYVWARRISLVALLGFFALKLGDLLDLPLPGKKLLLQGTALIIAILTIFMGATLWPNVKSWIQTQRQDPKLSTFKRAMLPYLSYSYIPFILFIVVSYMSWTTHVDDPLVSVVWRVFITLITFPVTRALAVCLRKLRICYLYKHLKTFPPLISKWLLDYSNRINFISITFLNVLAFSLILKIWELDLTSLFLSTFGKLIFERSISIFMIILIALAITRAGERLLTKYLTSVKESENTAQKQKMARLKTIYSVSRNILRIAVWTPATILVIVELNINVVPLLTTVGIFSVGLSFGVQSLVKDFVTGFFMLLEDTFAVGDLVLINDQIGRVESLTVRVVRVRSSDGALHTFPYGNITSLCNRSRDYSVLIVLFNVGLNADLNQISDILKKISQDLSKDPDVRKLISGAVRMDGVNTISEYALEVRALIKIQPGEYDRVRWAFNRLLNQYIGEEKIPPAIPREISYNYPIDKKQNFF